MTLIYISGSGTDSTEKGRMMWARVKGATTPLFPYVKKLFPRWVTTTEQVGRAMLAVARQGYPKPILESWDIAAKQSL
jgi:hypothetical protein